MNSDNGFGMQHDFEWWTKNRIENLQKYSWTNENQYYKYFVRQGKRKSLFLSLICKKPKNRTTRYIAKTFGDLRKFSAIYKHRQIVDLAFKNE